ncbi:MAG TPA: NUDIX hydrolase [Anaerolineae bacterium]|nr:NUDIX hydrolase [Anaerolineae bacterium]
MFDSTPLKSEPMAQSTIVMNYCPRCGHPLEDKFVFGRVRRACPECNFVFFREPKVAAGVLVEQAGSVLLVRRSVDPKKGAWALPAGYMEIDEGPVAAALRECLEETGLVVRITGLFGVYHIANDPRGAGILILYRAVVVSGEAQPADDADEVAFFTPREIPADIAFASTRRALLRWRIEVEEASGKR